MFEEFSSKKEEELFENIKNSTKLKETFRLDQFESLDEAKSFCVKKEVKRGVVFGTASPLPSSWFSTYNLSDLLGEGSFVQKKKRELWDFIRG